MQTSKALECRYCVPGVLFLGSRSGDSQLLALPEGLLREKSLGPAPGPWEVLDPAFISNAGPIHDAIGLEEPQGEVLAGSLS